MGKLSKDRRDIFYRKAKEDGYRARSAYKLIHIDDMFGILRPTNQGPRWSGDVSTDETDETCVEDGEKRGPARVVDLCAAPGGWSQVLRDRLTSAWRRGGEDGNETQRPLIVAVDLQEMAPLEGVIQIRGDITSPTTMAKINEYLEGAADIVLCDGAPDVTGMHDIDEYIQMQLVLSALMVATVLLGPGGCFVAKVFRGENISLLYLQLHLFFQEVHCCKPGSSRIASLEAFVVCRKFRLPPGYIPSLKSCEEFERSVGTYLSSNVNSYLTPFVAAGDMSGLDGERTYPTTEPFRDPIQPPRTAPYLDAVAVKRGETK